MTLSAALNMIKKNKELHSVASFNFKNNPEKCRYTVALMNSTDIPTLVPFYSLAMYDITSSQPPSGSFTSTSRIFKQSL